MKKITFRRCTVMAAVFAACLFAAGCKPNQPNPAPNPEPAPNPAPNPAPKPAPSPSIEVPMPGGPSVTPGASVQEEALVEPVQEPTVNVKIKVQSVQLPDPAHPVVYGVVHAYRGEKIYSIAVPKSIVDDTAKRAEKMRSMLATKFKSEGIGDYKLYRIRDNGVNPNHFATDAEFTKNIDGVGTIGKVFIGELKKKITINSLYYNETTGKDMEHIVLAPTTAYAASASGGLPETTMTEAEIKALGLPTGPIPITVWNTDGEVARRAAVKTALTILLDTKLGTGKWVLYRTNAIAAAASELTYGNDYNTTVTDLFTAAHTEELSKAFWGIKERDMVATITVKPITRKVKTSITGPVYHIPTDIISGTVSASEIATGGTNLKNTDTAGVISAGIEKVLQNRIAAAGETWANYEFFFEGTLSDTTGTAHPQKINTANGLKHGMTIYIGKKL